MRLERRAPTPPDEAYSRACRLVGRCAPIRAVFARRRRPDQVDLFIHTAVANHALLLHGAPAPGPTFGCGAARSRTASITAAVGEALERVFGSAAALRDPRHATERELDGDVLDPCRLAPFSEAQRRAPGFPFARFSAVQAIAWVRAFSLTRQRPVWVPAEAVYLGAHCREVHLVASSSGLAAGPSLEEALAAAIYELIERDAFMVAWMARRCPPEIDLERCADPEAAELCRRAAAARVELRAFDVTTDVGVPACLAIAIGTARQVPSLAVGAASRLCTRAALRKALLEALHTWNWTFELVAARGELAAPADEAKVAIRDFADLVYLYAHPWRRRSLDFLLAPREKIALAERTVAAPTPADEVECLTAALQRVGCEVLAVDLGPDPEWDAGFRVVRALSPDLVPLALAGHRSYRACERYFTVPRRLGDAAPPRDEGDLNRDPHPFP